MSNVIIQQFKYLVVRTGYTRRLVKKIDRIEAKFAEDFDCPCENEECNLTCRRVLYIHDSIWGDGLYSFGDEAEIARIQGILEEHKSTCDGIIVLKCNMLDTAFRLTEELMKVKYCASFGFHSLYSMNLLNEEVLVISFDCESG